MDKQYSRRSPAVKRLMKEAQELSSPTAQCHAQPLEDNLFEWHFTVRGPSDSNFEGGVYHGRITLPPDYPMKPPSIMLLTPTGRFEVGTKICLSISGHHPETWQPSWSIRTVMLAIIGFMPSKGEGAIGSLDYTPEERKLLAKKSQDWTCPMCKIANKSILPKETSVEKSKEMQREATKIASQISFKKEDTPSSESTSTNNPPQLSPTQANPVPPNPNAATMAGMFPFIPNPAAVPAGSNQLTDSSTAVTAPSSAPSASPRTQPAPSATPSPPRGVTQLPQPRVEAQIPPRQEQSGGQWAIVAMVITTLIMIFLLVRRAYITYEYKFYQGEL